MQKKVTLPIPITVEYTPYSMHLASSKKMLKLKGGYPYWSQVYLVIA